MMVPDSAVRFSRWMKEKGVLDQQKAESWQTIWSPMDVSVDKNDAYTSQRYRQTGYYESG